MDLLETPHTAALDFSLLERLFRVTSTRHLRNLELTTIHPTHPTIMLVIHLLTSRRIQFSSLWVLA
jgi:hypothetical protein